MSLPLEGVRVLDFSRVLAGPVSGMHLADFGAEVIRVEPPGGALDRRLGPYTKDGRSLVPLTTNRNKLGATLDIRSPTGKALLMELVAQADVLIHNFTPDTAEANILSYESLRSVNPTIIVGIISAFGVNGPYRHRSAVDNILQAESGAMSYSGFPGSPPSRTGAAYVDVLCGAHTALGILLALRERERTGMGQMVDTSLMDTAVSVIGAFAVPAEYVVRGQLRQPKGNKSFWAFSDTLLCRDGRWVVVSIIGNGMWRNFCEALGNPEWSRDPRFQNDEGRRIHMDQLSELVAAYMSKHDSSDVLARLVAAHVPCGQVNDVSEVLSHPQVRARDMLVDMSYPGIGVIPINGLSVKLSGTGGSIRHRAPEVGEHDEFVWRELLGVSAERLKSARMTR
ncbi:MAG: CoA transferase [Chloroflexota bacterium]